MALERLGELLQVQLLHPQGQSVVEVLGAVVRVQAQHIKGEGRQQTLKDRPLVAPGNTLRPPL